MRDSPGRNRYWISTICIDSYKGDVPSGWISNPFFEAPQRFESLMQFIKIKECTLDLTKQPQSFTSQRCFTPSPEHVFSKKAAAVERGKLASFSLCIRFWQNASWQGQLHWLEDGSRQNFRSTLELTLLMDSALQAARRRREGAKENSA